MERSNQTILSLIRKYVQSQGKSWDQCVPFVANNSISESLQVTPNQLVFGKNRRGLLETFREGLEGSFEGEPKDVQQCLEQLQTTLQELEMIAHNNLAQAQRKQSQRYNQQARPRVFKEGSEVALLIPGERGKLEPKWQAPFKVLQALPDNNYKIQLVGQEGQRAQLVHANRLKPWYRSK